MDAKAYKRVLKRAKSIVKRHSYMNAHDLAHNAILYAIDRNVDDIEYVATKKCYGLFLDALRYLRHIEYQPIDEDEIIAYIDPISELSSLDLFQAEMRVYAQEMAKQAGNTLLYVAINEMSIKEAARQQGISYTNYFRKVNSDRARLEAL